MQGATGYVYQRTAGGVPLSESAQSNGSMTDRLAAGVNTFRFKAMKTGARATSLSYMVMRVTVLRWAD